MPSRRDCRMLHASAAGRGLYTSACSFACACRRSSSHTGFLYQQTPHHTQSILVKQSQVEQNASWLFTLMQPFFSRETYIGASQQSL